MKHSLPMAACAALATLVGVAVALPSGSTVAAQDAAPGGVRSVGRGAPLAAHTRDYQPTGPSMTFEHEVLDMYGRPWAQLWEKYYEQGMEKPRDEDIFDFSR
jgi:hypothetical protein